MITRLRDLVALESPPEDPGRLTACADVLDRWGTAVLGRPAQRVMLDGLPHLLWPAADQRVLLLGHYDTVWPAGTHDGWPFALAGDRATGPGVADMKAGIVQMLTALELVGDTSRVGLLLTCDEETGSPASRPLIEEQAARSGAVLVGEPSTESGELKVARKGGSVYRITVHGRAAHAGVEPHRGINASVEAAFHVLAVREFAAEGTTVTPTMVTAGTMTNVVPEKAEFCVDVRAWTSAELDRVDGLIRGLSPRLPGARLTFEGASTGTRCSIPSRGSCSNWRNSQGRRWAWPLSTGCRRPAPPTRTSPARSGCRRCAGSVGSAGVRTPATSGWTSRRCRTGRRCSPVSWS